MAGFGKRGLNKIERAVLVFFTVVGLFINIYYVFGLNWFGPMLNITSRYALMIFFLPFVFLVNPLGNTKKKHYIDLGLAGVSFLVALYLTLKSWEIAFLSWADPTPFNFFVGVVLVALVGECGRRVGGIAYLAVCVILGAFPLVAGNLPGVLHGRTFGIVELIGAHAFGPEVGLCGFPTQILVELIVGFLVIASALLYTGGGDFFLDLAKALLGRFRGGPAKVTVLGSGFFGMMSGSAISNVVGVGSFTIPAMKRLGYEPHYAGGIEAVSSEGGIIMPPVMGAVAFIMAELTQIPYASIIVYASLPAILYYYSLIWQVDAYAAKHDLKGMNKSEIPSFWRTLKKGWHFILVLAFLVFGLLFLRWEALTPYYTTIVLFVLSIFRKETRIGPKKAYAALEGTGRLVANTLGILAPTALVLGGLTLTGAVPATTAALVTVGKISPWIAIAIGAVISYILGTVGIGSYIFLAIGMAPGLESLGFDRVAVHLFFIYYGITSGITPPVAHVAFVAAIIAQAPPMKTAWTACRLGIVTYFVPLFFLFNPGLLFRTGTIVDTALIFFYCLIGVALLAGGVEGYLVFLGKLNWLARIAFIVTGLLIAFPETWTTVAGFIGAGGTAAIIILMKRARKPSAAAGSGS